jgi:Leucine-rich repeat (LRR) protein
VTHINLDHNRVRRLEAFARLYSLQVLSASYNKEGRLSFALEPKYSMVLTDLIRRKYSKRKEENENIF